MPLIFSKALVVSPHFDDAVLSCGSLLAGHPGAIVCTVFSGCPTNNISTEWDSRCGFAGAHEAMRQRAIEDDQALAILGARSDRLGFLDEQYAGGKNRPSPEDIAQELRSRLYSHSIATILIPLGLFHPDHILTNKACCEALIDNRSITCIAYEDVPYRFERDILHDKIGFLRGLGSIVTPILSRDIRGCLSEKECYSKKFRAVCAYESQIKILKDEFHNALPSERFWRLQAANSNQSERLS
jgi:LmbE family N-acetylglucosaminyl deacetylase